MVSWILILYFDSIPVASREVARRVMIGYSLRYSKVIEYPIKDSPLLIGGYISYASYRDH